MVSHPCETAGDLARKLIQDELAACVHMLPAGESIYSWKDEICQEKETLLMIKTAADPKIFTERVLDAHPYECPEIIGFEVSEGHREYLDWIEQLSKGDS